MITLADAPTLASSAKTTTAQQRATPLLQLENICRRFPSGDGEVTVLNNINLTIHAGEMISIIGASGSGKSTLMNILGGLDQASSGHYRIAGRELGELDHDALAALRRDHFGFIFQRYNLLADLSAEGNVAMPAIYAGATSHERRARALQLLARLGLAGKENLRPSQLSGGQQQRVSIARALMNGGEVILADEPTGALDSKSGAEVMQILHELNALGHTIIIVTHDPKIAAQTPRVVEISDGRILSDATQTTQQARQAKTGTDRKPRAAVAWLGRFAEAFQMALIAMLANRMRTALTLLGLVIGITSVVSMMTISEAARSKVMGDINAIAGKSISIYPGKDWGDFASKSTLSIGDLRAIAELPYVDGISPESRTPVSLRYRNMNANASVTGVAASYADLRNMSIREGQMFSDEHVRAQALVVVIDSNTRKKLFGDAPAIGQVILLGNIGATVIGVMGKEKNMFAESGNSLQIWMPHSTMASRLLGDAYFQSLLVRVNDGSDTTLAEAAITDLIKARHGRKDFFTDNMDAQKDSFGGIILALQMLLTFTTVISLVVGGVGVMNIMLVSVSERTREIGVRMAVGARQDDVQQQFLTESVLVCLVGGLIGISLSYTICLVVGLFLPDWPLSMSLAAILAAVGCSSLVGIVFGYIPARNAAQLNPIEALTRE